MAIKGMIVNLAAVLLLAICITKTYGAPAEEELSRAKRGFVSEIAVQWPRDAHWRYMSQYVACWLGKQGSKKVANTLRDELRYLHETYLSDYSQWVVFATEAGHGMSYYESSSWEHEEDPDVCGFDIHVFKRSSRITCSTDIVGDAERLQSYASSSAANFGKAKSIMKRRDYQYSLESDLIITYEEGFVSSWIDQDCINLHSNSGPENIASVFVGSYQR